MRGLSFPAAMVLMIAAAGAVFAQGQGLPVAQVMTPAQDAAISGAAVEIAVYFASTNQQPVTKVQVFLDGKYISEMAYEAAHVEDTASFKWDTTRTANGPHKLDIRLFSGDQYLGMTSRAVTVMNGARDLAPPRVAVNSPRDGVVVSGVTPIIVAASDDSGREPLVSIYIDKSLRCVRNRSPYSYDWDTTRYSNGPHVVEAHAEDDAGNISDMKAVRVTVQNPGSQSPIMIQAPSEKPAEPRIASTTSTAVPAEPRGATPMNAGTRSSSESKDVARATSAVPQTFEVGQTPLTRMKQTPTASKPRTPAPLTIPASAAGEKKPEPILETKPMPAPAPTLVAKAEPELESPKCPPCAACPKSGTCAASGDVYVVRAGDSIDRLSRKLGVPAVALVALNDIQDPALIRIGQKLRIPDCGVGMVAVRTVFEAAGGTLTWTGGTKRSVRAVSPDRDVMLKIGSSTAVVNGSSQKMDRPAMLSSGRTMVAESFVTRTLGMAVPER